MRLSIVAGLGLLLAAGALAEEAVPAAERYNGAAYVTFGAGSCQHGYPNLNISGGGYGFLWKGITLGGESGYYSFVQQGSFRFGIAELNAGYHFGKRRKSARFDPFVNVGFVGAGFACCGVTSAGSIGGGAVYWFKPRIGLRLEGRVQAISEEGIGMFRIGFTFR